MYFLYENVHMGAMVIVTLRDIEAFTFELLVMETRRHIHMTKQSNACRFLSTTTKFSEL